MVGLAFAFAIGYSRIFLGVHSLDQILFGWLFGIWLAFTLQFIVREPISKVIDSLIYLKQPTPHVPTLLLQSFVLFAAIVAIEIANYMRVNADIQIPALWAESITTSCGAARLKNAFQKKSMIE